MTNKDTSTLTISSISGKLAADTTPSALVVKTMGQNANLPKDTE
ncbi:MAG: hypothetical protein Q4B28_00610 [bacterium]|nr:hypothetical protein [bacterium]